MSRTGVDSRGQAALILGGAILLCVLGWHLFLFLTDDAFIAFRYISNRQLGHGYTWNAPPFLPVEGYTSFLWVVLLDGVWAVTGVEPPAAANFLSLLCSIGTLLVTVALARRLLRSAGREADLPILLPLVLLGVVSNRTFLAWTSSGLETALFNLLLHTWLFLAFFGVPGKASHSALLALTASLLSLARPDGYLFLAATGVLLCAEAFHRRAVLSLSFAAAIVPLVIVPAHVLWRHSFYGEWLPNTYYAKVVEAWPESGVRYLGAFVLEYALWFWLLLVGAAVLKRLASSFRAVDRASSPLSFRAAVALLTLALHFSYYTFVIGGDHFEFRVYSHVVPLVFLSFLWAVLALGISPRPGAAAFVAFLVLGWVIPWTHWAKSRTLLSRQETHVLRLHVAEDLPFPLRVPAAHFDSLQDWLIERHVGMRHQEHRVFSEMMRGSLPGRSEGARLLEDEQNPVAVALSVGVVGWVLPRVHVIDMLGLNDYVIARNRVPEGAARVMAHDRRAPPGYLQAFRPNLFIDAFGEGRRYLRSVPLTDEEIRAIEKRFRAEVATP
jgi:arabinofuranosyltransferase